MTCLPAAISWVESHSPWSANVCTLMSERYNTAACLRCSGFRYALRELIAKPSFSRTMGQTTIRTSKSRSRTILRTMAACAASFWPKTARSGCTMLNSLATTVVTPRKWPERERPSSLSLNPSTVTQVEVPGGYISSTDGQNATSTLSACSRAESFSRVRGYLEKSSLGPNCMGLTKIETTTRSDCVCAARTSDRCPSCSAPMVGANPMRLPDRRASLLTAVISPAEEMVSIKQYLVSTKYSALLSSASAP